MKLHFIHSSQQSGSLPEHILYGYDHKPTSSSPERLSNEENHNNSSISENNNKNGPKVTFC